MARDIKATLNDMIAVAPFDLKELLVKTLNKIEKTPPEKMSIRVKEAKMALKRYIPGHPSEFKDWHKKVMTIWFKSGYNFNDFE